MRRLPATPKGVSAGGQSAIIRRGKAPTLNKPGKTHDQNGMVYSHRKEVQRNDHLIRWGDFTARTARNPERPNSLRVCDHTYHRSPRSKVRIELSSPQKRPSPEGRFPYSTLVELVTYMLHSNHSKIYVPSQDYSEQICYKITRGDFVNINERIDGLIEDGNIKVQDLASRLGVTRQQIARWRKGTSEPGAYKIKELCDIYKVSADYILGLPKGLTWPR